MRFAIPLWVPDLLIKADVKTAKVSVSLGAWSGMPIIAIGPKGGKIVGYGVGGKKIYANTSQAQALAAHLKVQHETDQKKQVAQVLDWLKALGISAQEAGGHGIAVSQAVGEMLTQHFHVKPVQNLATFQVFPLAALLPHRGKPFHPSEDEHTGWAAAVASGDDGAAVFPDLNTLQEVSAGSFAGSHGNKLFKTPTGKKWVFKSENPTIARAEEASARIQRLILGDRVPAVKFVEVNGKAGALIQVIPGTPLNENHSASANLSQMQKYAQQIAASFVADWLTSNHDGHSGNFLADGPLLNAIDKGQSWRFFGKDKLEPGYHPNPSPTVYNKFWSAFEAGSIDPELVLAGLSAAVIRAEKITLDQFKLIAAPYVATAAPFGGFDAGQRLNEMASRLAMLRKDIESFATGVFKKPVKLAQEPGADNFETMPEAESKDAKAPKLVIQNPDQPQVIEGGAKQPVVTAATPGWPLTKGDTTIHSPGTPPPAGTQWPGGVPGPGFVLATKYKGKDYQLAITEGSKGLGPLFEVKYPDGSIATYDSMNKAGDSLYLFANGLPLTMSATEKKAKKIGLGSKAFKLGAFKAELSGAHSAPESTAAMAPAELEAAGVVAKGAETLSPWQALAATKNGTVLTDHSVLPANVQAAAKVAAKGEKQYVGGFAPGSVTWGIVTNGPLAGQKYLLVAQGASHYEIFSESGSVAVWSAKHVQEYFGIGLADEPTLIPTPIPSPGPPPKAVLPADGVKAKGALNVTGGPLAAGTVVEKTIFVGPEAVEGTHKLVVKDDGTFEVSHSFSDPADGHPVVQTSEHKTLAHAAAFAHHVQVHGAWPDDALPSYKKLLASIDGWKYWGITPVAEAPAQPQESPAYEVTSSQALMDDFKPGGKIVFTLGDGMIYTAIRVSPVGDYTGEWVWHTDLNPTLNTELPADKLFELLSEPKAKIVEMKHDAASVLDLMGAGPAEPATEASADNFETMPEVPKVQSAVTWSVNENGGYPLWEDMKPGMPQKFSAESLQTGIPEPTSFLYHAPIGTTIFAGDGVAYQKGGSGSWHSSENDTHLKGAWLAKQIAATSLSGWSAWKPAHEAIDPDPNAWAEGKVGTSLTALTMPPGKNFLTEAPPGTSMVAHTTKMTILAKKSPEGFWLIAHPESEQGQKSNEDLSMFLDSKLGDVWVQAPLPGSTSAPKSDAEKFTVDMVSQGWTAHADSYPTAALGSYPVGTEIQVYSSGHIIAHLKLGDDLTYTVNGQDLGDAAKALQYLKGLATGVAEQGKKLQVFTKIPGETSPDNWKTMPEVTVDLGIKATAVLGGAETGTLVLFPPTSPGTLPAVWKKDQYGDWDLVQSSIGKPAKASTVPLETLVEWTNNYHDNGLELGVIFPPGSAKAAQQAAQKPEAAPPPAPAPKTKQPSVLKSVKIVYASDIAPRKSYPQAAKAFSQLQAWKNEHPSLVQKPSNWDSWVPPPGVLIEGKHEGQTYYLVTTTTGANQGTYEPGEKVAFAIIAPDGSLHQGTASDSSVKALKLAGKAAGIPTEMKYLKAVFGLSGVDFAAGESHWSLHGLEDLPIAPNMLGDVAAPQPKPKAPAKVTPAPMDPAKAALIEKAKAVAAWAKDHPIPTAVESLNVLAHFQNHAKQQHPKMELWARTTDGALLLGSGHEGFAAMMASLGIAGKTVETPLGTFYEMTTAELAAATPGQPAMGMTEGPDGKTYPKGTTFTTSEVQHSVESLLKSEPGFYKITAHKTDAESAVLKVSGSGEEQKKQIEAMLQKYSIPTTGTVAGSSNVLAFVKKADLAKVWKTETIVSPTTPPQPPAFTQAALPVDSTSVMWAEMKSHPATELALIPSTKIGRFGKVLVMGTPGVLRDFQVSVRKVKDKNGNFFHEVSGQLANFNGENSSLSLGTVAMPTGATKDSGGKFTLNYIEEGGYTDESGEGAGSFRTASGRLGSTDSGSAIEVETSDNPTFGGFFRVRIPEGADLESELKHAFTKMGYDGDAVVAPLDADSDRIFKKWSIVRSLLGPTGWNKALTAKTMIHKESWLDKLLAEHSAAHLVEQATIRQTFDGHVSVVLQDGEKFKDAGWTCATRYDKDVDSLFFQIAQGVGWSSRKTKYVMGSPSKGWSPDADVGNGGATGAYFRVRTGSPSLSMSYEIIAHPRVFSRTDWWRYDSDNYGSILKTSGGMKRYETDSGTSGSNEIMFAGGVSLSDIMAVTVTNESEKTDLTSRLNAIGITQVNGVDLSDFILVGAYNVLSRIHPALKA